MQHATLTPLVMSVTVDVISASQMRRFVRLSEDRFGDEIGMD